MTADFVIKLSENSLETIESMDTDIFLLALKQGLLHQKMMNGTWYTYFHIWSLFRHTYSKTDKSNS